MTKSTGEIQEPNLCFDCAMNPCWSLYSKESPMLFCEEKGIIPQLHDRMKYLLSFSCRIQHGQNERPGIRRDCSTTCSQRCRVSLSSLIRIAVNFISATAIILAILRFWYSNKWRPIFCVCCFLFSKDTSYSVQYKVKIQQERNKIMCVIELKRPSWGKEVISVAIGS